MKIIIKITKKKQTKENNYSANIQKINSLLTNKCFLKL